MVAGQVRKSRHAPFPGLGGENAPAILFAVFLVLVALFGGASRADALSQVVVRSIAIAFACAALLMAQRRGLRGQRTVIAFLAVLAALILAQIIPLPPSLWMALPGREVIAEGAPLAGIDQPWRPISMSPDQTINALLALLPAFAAILIYANVARERRPAMVIVLVGIAMLSAVVGLAQITTQAPWLYPYRITNDGTAVGLFANRNHQALLLSMTFPLLAGIASFPDIQAKRGGSVQFLLLVMGLFIIPLVLATGSRAGFAAMLVGIAAAVLVLLTAPSQDSGRRGRRRRFPVWLWLAVTGIAVLVVLATVHYSRGEAIQRLFERDLAEDKRVLAFQPMMEMAQAYFPLGTGFGSFPNVFRVHEPFDNLALTYMNHAHNDLLELVIEGGAVAVLLLLAFLLWFVRRTWLAWVGPGGDGASRLLSRLGSILVTMMLLASLFDYPLRTPTMAAIFALACGWLAHTGGRRRSAEEAAAGD